jgi:transcriptional regulator with GAF, ATPase, and Fis domain
MAYAQDDGAVGYLDDWWLHRKDADARHLQLAGNTPSADDCLEARVGEYEKGLIEEALGRTRGNQTKAARLLGTTKRVIQYKVKKYGIDFARLRRL